MSAPGSYSLFEPASQGYMSSLDGTVKYYMEAHYMIAAFIIVALVLLVIYLVYYKRDEAKKEEEVKKDEKMVAAQTGGYSVFKSIPINSSADISAFEGATGEPIGNVGTIVKVGQVDECNNPDGFDDNQAYSYMLNDAMGVSQDNFQGQKYYNLKMEKASDRTDDNTLSLIAQGFNAPTSFK